jgi:hypothetical protein
MRPPAFSQGGRIRKLDLGGFEHHVSRSGFGRPVGGNPQPDRHMSDEDDAGDDRKCHVSYLRKRASKFDTPVRRVESCRDLHAPLRAAREVRP